ncbi:MAG: hypothetical protein ABIO88_11930 [Burkholderiaceae bacterium]
MKQRAYKVCRSGLTPALKTSVFVFDFLQRVDAVRPTFTCWFEHRHHWQKHHISRGKMNPPALADHGRCVALMAAMCQHTLLTFGNDKLL